jgi:acyl-CoA synthetase (AMP-forming)/AMP-acid ligase II
MQTFCLFVKIQGLTLMAVYSKNCPEFVVAEQACFAAGGATVPLYDTLGPETVQFVLAETGASVVVCYGAREVAACLAVARACPELKLVVAVDPTVRPRAGGGGQPEVVGFGTLEAEGYALPSRAKHAPPSPHDVATFCYTSGTTGDPKGALVTHANLVAAVANLECSDIADFTREDVHFSYLPLPHIFERVVQMNVFAFGAAVGFSCGDPLKLVGACVFAGGSNNSVPPFDNTQTKILEQKRHACFPFHVYSYTRNAILFTFIFGVLSFNALSRWRTCARCGPPFFPRCPGSSTKFTTKSWAASQQRAATKRRCSTARWPPKPKRCRPMGPSRTGSGTACSSTRQNIA